LEGMQKITQQTLTNRKPEGQQVGKSSGSGCDPKHLLNGK
jgi:hypothetical protein